MSSKQYILLAIKRIPIHPVFAWQYSFNNKYYNMSWTLRHTKSRIKVTSPWYYKMETRLDWLTIMSNSYPSITSARILKIFQSSNPLSTTRQPLPLSWEWNLLVLAYLSKWFQGMELYLMPIIHGLFQVVIIVILTVIVISP